MPPKHRPGRRLFLAALLILAACTFTVCRADDPPAIADRILEFCKEHQGKRVGNGSCTSFVGAALQSAGARLGGPDAVKQDPHRKRADDFNWGEFVFAVERVGADFKTKGDAKAVRPGDIIQFTHTTVTGSFDDGSTYTMTAKHHTAIVAGVLAQGTVLNIYHQGANGRRAVSGDQLRLLDLQSGRFTIFHPIARTIDKPTPRSPASNEPDDSATP